MNTCSKKIMPRVHIWVLLMVSLFSFVTAKKQRQLFGLPYSPYCKFDEKIYKSEEKLASEVAKSHIVFSGKVVSDVSFYDNSTISFFVFVKRYFKVADDFETRHYVKVIKKLRSGEGRSCRQVVRIRFTGIFIGNVSKNPGSDVELTITPVHVSLQNLERITDAVKKDSSLKVPPKPIIEEPCAKTFCAWGGHCVASPDGRSTCQCPTKCKDVSDPVCGTDGKTYRNLCVLKMSTCKARSSTRIAHNGPCEIKDPCYEKNCNYGARCVVSSDGKEASCKCPEACHSYGDHMLSRPVCGSDGIDYKDMCELNKAACKSNSNITVKFQGKCDPCESVECPDPEICQLDQNRNPICRCSESCPFEINPVCASDGKTYENECFLRQEVCRSGRSISMMYSGKCTTDENPCEELECRHYRECSIDKRGHATCICPPPCEMKMKPVCGSDDRTYSSLCELKRTACTFNLTLEPAYQGVCGEMGPCSHHACHFGAVCQEKNGIAACECFTCSSEFEPVCGSDGITYGNECKLKLESCKQQQDIHLIYKAPCDGCENLKCDFYSTCEANGDLGTQCVCPTSCNDAKLLKSPICGSDGVTYVNECEMRMISCKSQRYIAVAHRESCNSCQGDQCQIDLDCKSGKCFCPTECNGAKEEPVCASTNKTYNNECEFQRAHCEQSSDIVPITILFYGNCSERFSAVSTQTTFSSVGFESISGNLEFSQTKQMSYNNSELELETAEKCRDIICDFDATCEVGPDNFPRCSCQFECENVAPEQPVCASDKKMYSSLCSMKMEACQRQQELRLRPLEVCKGSEVRPCNGEKPVVDPFTNEELDCGNNANRRDCPSGSYCHITLTVARCCPIEVKKESNTCKDSWYGCCPDEKSPAQGPNNAGCPSVCRCNRLGSYSKSCDPKSLQCPCKPGVGGQKCDSCLPGFWGLQHIDRGSVGCIPCACSAFGSVRVDCEQMTGRCVCKPGVQGNKCTFCSSPDKVLGPNGCVPAADVAAPPPSTCKELTCHFGASCIEQGGTAFCDCYNECNEKTDNQIVCGSDGQTYTSSCQLQLLACRLQKDIVVQAFGPCKGSDDALTGTEHPFRRYTPLQFTQSDESNSPLSKSTRHLFMPDLRYYYDRERPYVPAQSSYPQPHHPHSGKSSSSTENELYSPGTSNFDSRGENIAAGYRPTPATVRVITALLGDLCSDDSDCPILHSSCLGGACTCLPGYIDSSDRQACNEGSSTEEFRACFSSPCAEGSRCIDLPSASFACICPVNSTGQLCDTPLSRTILEVPSFDGKAFVKLRPLKAYYKLSIEIEFKAYTNNGILLYNQQRPNGLGDFISIAIVNGFIEFRYNLGNGPTIIKSLDRVNLNNYHRVVVKRYRRDGFLKMDEDESIAGQSKGTWEALDLAEETFVGNVVTEYKKVYENIGTNQGLRGCIRKLKIGRKNVNIHGGVDDLVLAMNGVQECGSNPCSGSPCQNDGICHILEPELYRCECGPSFIGDFCENVIDPCLSNPCKGGSECFSLDAENFMCQCPAGRKGKTCDLVDTNLTIKIPEFNGSSYIKLPTLKGVMKTFSMEVVFLTKTLNGLILYNGQKKKNRGDFISLNLIGGYVQFRFNLGSGIANITSSKAVQLNKWHRLRLLRDGREGFLQLDDSSIDKGWSGPSLTDLNLELPFFVGSVESWRDIHRLSGANKGLKGALQRLVVNGESIPISANFPQCSFAPENITTCSFGVGFYDGPPCVSSKSPCRNNGLCIPNLDDYICKCSHGFEGKYCQIAKEDATSIKFSGDTFLQYRNRGYKKKKAERGNKYTFKLRTFSTDGLLLWRSKTRSINEDYFSVAIVNGFPELSYNLGKQKAFWAIRTRSRVDDGEWHTIEVRRRKKMGFISVDHELPVKGVSNNGALTLSTNSKLWIGGMPSLPPGLPSAYYKGFEGCIKHVSISSRPLNLFKHVSPKKIEFCHDNEI